MKSDTSARATDVVIRGVDRPNRFFWRRRLLSVMKWYLIAVLVLKPIVYTVFQIPGRWSGPIEGVLADKRVIQYWSRFNGRETDDLLCLVDGSIVTQHVINDTHALNVVYITIRVSNDSRLLWVEGHGRVLSSLELDTGQFWKEGLAQPSGATYGNGLVVASGWTINFIDVFLP